MPQKRAWSFSAGPAGEKTVSFAGKGAKKAPLLERCHVSPDCFWIQF